MFRRDVHIMEGTLAHPQVVQPLQIHIRIGERSLPREARPLCDQTSVICNECLPAVNDILCTLPHTGGGKHIGRHAAGRLLGNQLPAVGCLACQLRAGAGVKQNIRPLERSPSRGRYHTPQVLTHLDTETKLPLIAEQQIRADGNTPETRKNHLTFP